MAVVDASMLIALFDASHSRHAEARQAIARHPTLDVCGGIIGETTRILRRTANLNGQDGNRVARQALASLRSMPGYRLFSSYDEAAAAGLYQANTSLSYVDAWGIQVALEAREELLTIDDGQRKAWLKARRSLPKRR